LNLKRPFHLIGQTALPSVQALTALTNALMLKKKCLKPPLTVNYAQFLKQKYVAGHVTRAVVTCKRPQ